MAQIMQRPSDKTPRSNFTDSHVPHGSQSNPPTMHEAERYGLDTAETREPRSHEDEQSKKAGLMSKIKKKAKKMKEKLTHGYKHEDEHTSESPSNSSDSEEEARGGRMRINDLEKRSGLAATDQGVYQEQPPARLKELQSGISLPPVEQQASIAQSPADQREHLALPPAPPVEPYQGLYEVQPPVATPENVSPVQGDNLVQTRRGLKTAGSAADKTDTRVVNIDTGRAKSAESSPLFGIEPMSSISHSGSPVKQRDDRVSPELSPKSLPLGIQEGVGSDHTKLNHNQQEKVLPSLLLLFFALSLLTLPTIFSTLGDKLVKGGAHAPSKAPMSPDMGGAMALGGRDIAAPEVQARELLQDSVTGAKTVPPSQACETSAELPSHQEQASTLVFLYRRAIDGVGRALGYSSKDSQPEAQQAGKGVGEKLEETFPLLLQDAGKASGQPVGEGKATHDRGREHADAVRDAAFGADRALKDTKATGTGAVVGTVGSVLGTGSQPGSGQLEKITVQSPADGQSADDLTKEQTHAPKDSVVGSAQAVKDKAAKGSVTLVEALSSFSSDGAGQSEAEQPSKSRKPGERIGEAVKRTKDILTENVQDSALSTYDAVTKNAESAAGFVKESATPAHDVAKDSAVNSGAGGHVEDLAASGYGATKNKGASTAGDVKDSAAPAYDVAKDIAMSAARMASTSSHVEDAIAPAYDAAKDIAARAAGYVQDSAASGHDISKSQAASTAGIVKDSVAPAYDAAKDVAARAAGYVQDSAASGYDTTKSQAASTADFVKDSMAPAYDAAKDTAARAAGYVQDSAASGYDTIKCQAASTAGIVKDSVVPAYDAAKDVAARAAGYVQDSAASGFDITKSQAASTADFVKDSMAPAYDAAKDAAARAAGYVQDSAASGYDTTKSQAASTAGIVKDSVAPAYDAAKDVAARAAGYVQDSAASGFDITKSQAASTADYVKDSMAPAYDAAMDTAARAAGYVQDSATSGYGAIKNAASSVGGCVHDSATAAYDAGFSGGVRETVHSTPARGEIPKRSSGPSTLDLQRRINELQHEKLSLEQRVQRLEDQLLCQQ